MLSKATLEKLKAAIPDTLNNFSDQNVAAMDVAVCHSNVLVGYRAVCHSCGWRSIAWSPKSYI